MYVYTNALESVETSFNINSIRFCSDFPFPFSFEIVYKLMLKTLKCIRKLKLVSFVCSRQVSSISFRTTVVTNDLAVVSTYVHFLTYERKSRSTVIISLFFFLVFDRTLSIIAIIQYTRPIMAHVHDIPVGINVFLCSYRKVSLLIYFS